MLNPILQLMLPPLIIIGVIYIFGVLVHIIRQKSSQSSEKPSLFSLWFLLFNRLRRIKSKYLVGYSLLIISLIYRVNPHLINNITGDWLTRITYNPQPGLESPWPWQDEKNHLLVSQMPSSVETSIESVAQYIAQHESNPYSRLKALHDYVANRITYDLDVLKTGIRPNQDAQTVFATHKAVCEGYANLFKALGQAIGEDIVVVTGKIRRDLAPKDLIPIGLRVIHSEYDWTLHAWNAVKISGKWHLVDVTWDDSNFSYKAEYLMPPPEVMSIGHFPDQLSWQLLPLSENYETFEKKPLLTPQFYAETLKIISPNQYQSEVQKTALIMIETPRGYQRNLSAIYVKQENEILFSKLLQEAGILTPQERKKKDIKVCQSQQDTGGKTQFSCQFTQPGVYKVLLYSYSPGQRQQGIKELGQLKFQAL